AACSPRRSPSATTSRCCAWCCSSAPPSCWSPCSSTRSTTCSTRACRRAMAASRLLARLRFALPIVWLAIVFTCAFGASWLPLHAPDAMDFSAVEQGPGLSHPLGTDLDGRDLLSRLAFGARISLTVSLIAPLIGLVLGTTLGLLSAYYAGALRTAILSLLDAMLAFPSLVFALA